MSSTVSVHLNENDFPDPHSFLPERFLEQRQYPGVFGHSAFGWGRRICPGLHLGHASVTLNITRILWGFNVNPAKDERGKDIEIDMSVIMCIYFHLSQNTPSVTDVCAHPQFCVFRWLQFKSLTLRVFDRRSFAKACATY